MKRLFDLVVATAALVLLLPVFAVVALGVLITMGRPVLFRQLRPGLYERPFHILKFRTMRPPAPGAKAADDGDRITPFGRFLRRTSLDELPELINVIKGEMSIVGPRPLRMEYLSCYTAEERHRHDVRPGITGLAQVSGRNNLDWDSKFALDLEYVRKQSLLFDLRIILKTIVAVLKREGVSHPGSETMPSLTSIRQGRDLSCEP